MSVDFNQLQEFIVAIAETDISELTLKDQDFELILRKEGNITPTIVKETNQSTEIISAPIVSQNDSSDVVTSSTPSPTEDESKWVAITSPMVGTFYRAPAPGEASFASVGDRIQVGQVVCIIEAMKLMNDIEAEIGGEVKKIVVENGEPVEYGQTLMFIESE